MTSFISGLQGRVLLVSLQKGELVLESLCEAFQKYGLRNAVLISGIGTLRKAVYHRIANTSDQAENQFITIEGPMEVSSVQGLLLDGEPHFHITFSDLKQTYAGHLEPGCEVQYLAEFAFAELPEEPALTRKKEPGGFSSIVWKQDESCKE